MDNLDPFRTSFELYKNLMDSKRSDLLKIVNSPHPKQFSVSNKVSGPYYRDLYIYQKSEESKKDQNLLPPPSDETCASCEKHFLSNRPKIDHSKDLALGEKLELVFQNFLNQYFKEKNISLVCERGDNELKNMPDFKITKKNNGEDVFYIELKSIFKPFIRVKQRFSDYRCYSHSMTLDCDDKLEKQRTLVTDNKILDRTAYVYWYDIPCIKGIFWMFSEDVYGYHNSKSEIYTRKTQTGDYQKDKKTGHIDKIYLSLLDMDHLSILLDHLESLA